MGRREEDESGIDEEGKSESERMRRKRKLPVGM
jgi:hypothetical protein